MNQSLLEILLVFFSEPPKSEKLNNICKFIGLRCDIEIDITCSNCILARCNWESVATVHEPINQIETTIRIITDEHTATPNNK